MDVTLEKGRAGSGISGGLERCCGRCAKIMGSLDGDGVCVD
jgi:hypothetical protein